MLEYYTEQDLRILHLSYGSVVRYHILVLTR